MSVCKLNQQNGGKSVYRAVNKLSSGRSLSLIAVIFSHYYVFSISPSSCDESLQDVIPATRPVVFFGTARSFYHGLIESGALGGPSTLGALPRCGVSLTGT